MTFRLNRGKNIKVLFLVFTVIFLSGCSGNQIKKELQLILSGEQKAEGIDIKYPWDSTIFPTEIPAPLFEWEDKTSHASEWNIYITNEKDDILISAISEKCSWRPDSTDWQGLKKNPAMSNLTFTAIAGKSVRNQYPSVKISFSFSKDPVGADIFYRAVTLPFSYAVKNVKTIEWYLGSVDGSKPRKMLDNIPVCGNCHSFPLQAPLLAMDVDYGNDKGSYIISDIKGNCSLKAEDVITWSDYKRDDGEPTFGLLSQISPDGRHVLSTVKDLSVFVAVDDNLAYSQLFFPVKGIIGIYDRRNKSFSALQGANDERYVQSNATWSPDGKKVLFTKTEAYIPEKIRKKGRALQSVNDVKEFLNGGKEFKFDLYSVDFNEGKGGESLPLEGASANGKSNYFPKFSPDGKWIVFCQAENFMLLRQDSRLYIMPSGGGTPRLMNCNMDEMNSWHSWSPNSKWIVFSSKNRGVYTQLYLTHIDENGNDSPPVLLENLCFDKRAANIPEFYPFNADEFKKITDDFSATPQYFNRAAFDAISNKYYKRASDDLDKAFQSDSNYLETYFNRMMLNIVLKQSNSLKEISENKKAMKIVLDSLRLKPDDENYLSLRITLLSNSGRGQEALNEAESLVKKYPGSYKFYELLSSFYKKNNKYGEAIECYRQMLKINPKEKLRLNNMIAETYMRVNKNDEALKIVNQLLNERSDDNELYIMRSQIQMNKKDFDKAKNDLDFIISRDSVNYKYNKMLLQLYQAQGNKRLQYFQLQKNIRILKDMYQKNNEDIEVIFELASLNLSMGDLDGAEGWFDRILGFFPDNYEALKQKAVIKLNKQMWNDAILIYDRLERNYRPVEEFLNNKAIAYIQIGNLKKALDYFDKTLEVNPGNKDAQFNRNKLKAEMTGRK
jgi:tetratricopeptide (TPR) repeat protein